MKQPLVSVIVPTKNSEQFLEACLKSIKNQSYKNVELIVVDNFSSDQTNAIAKRYADKIFTKGPERSAQRNYGAAKASGNYVVMIDSDMELTRDVISACVKLVSTNEKVAAIIIPEESFGKGFWAQCKRLERSFYVGNDIIEAARFFDTTLYKKLGGYQEAMVSGEDWDLTHRCRLEASVDRIDQYIMHNEGDLNLGKTLSKKYYYAGLARLYLESNKVDSKFSDPAGPLQRYKLFLSHPTKLFHNPLYGIGMLFMKTCEYGFGGLGYLRGKSENTTKTLFFINHSTGKPGRLSALLEYVSSKEYTYFMLTHPLDNYDAIPTSLLKDTEIVESISRKPRGTINLLEDFSYSVKYLKKYKFDVFIGTNNFDMLPAIFCRLIMRKKIKRIIYYPSDYSEERYSSKLMNYIYRTIETIAVRYSDFTISNTKRSENARITKHKLIKDRSIVIPNPIDLKVQPVKKEINKTSFIYVGDVSDEHGLSSIISTLRDQVGKLTVIGDGNDMFAAKKMLKKYKIKSEFLGRQSHDYVIKYLSGYKGIGLAPYNLNSKWTWYCSPTKIGEYIASGVPVLMSDVPEISLEIKAKYLGVVYDVLNGAEIAKKLARLNTDNFYVKSNKFYRENCVNKLLARLPL